MIKEDILKEVESKLNDLLEVLIQERQLMKKPRTRSTIAIYQVRRLIEDTFWQIRNPDYNKQDDQ